VRPHPVFSTNPGRIVSEIKVDLPQPRDRVGPAFQNVVERIYVAMTARPMTARTGTRGERFAGTGIDTVLTRVSSNLLSGLIETVAGTPYNGRADLPVIASALRMEIDELFPVAETLQMLRFAEVEGGDIRLSEEGKRFAIAPLEERKRLFQRHLLSYVPLAAHIRRVLDERASHKAPWSRFLDELEDHMTTEAAEQSLRAVISWARYGEAFAYDADGQMFSLENPS
jgi:NitT/TauT family transport system ATP-binding protein